MDDLSSRLPHTDEGRRRLRAGQGEAAKALHAARVHAALAAAPERTAIINRTDLMAAHAAIVQDEALRWHPHPR
jgi:histidine ammonia-lyase